MKLEEDVKEAIRRTLMRSISAGRQFYASEEFLDTTTDAILIAILKCDPLTKKRRKK